jgi:hypothetical protein
MKGDDTPMTDAPAASTSSAGAKPAASATAAAPASGAAAAAAAKPAAAASTSSSSSSSAAAAPVDTTKEDLAEALKDPDFLNAIVGDLPGVDKSNLQLDVSEASVLSLSSVISGRGCSPMGCVDVCRIF